MNVPFLKKYQPKFYNEFILDPEYISLLNIKGSMKNQMLKLLTPHNIGIVNSFKLLYIISYYIEFTFKLFI